MLQAPLRQSRINHVTGDVNYIGILLTKERTIQTVLDCIHMETHSGISRLILKALWLDLPIRRCARVTVISEAMKLELLRYVDCEPSKIVVIPVGISELFKPKPKPFKATRPTILQVGAASNKNLPRLIEALAGVDCTLHILGKVCSEDKAALRRYSVRHEFFHRLTTAQVVRLYEEADIVTFPSIYEGFGMPILEGQAVGRPVVTSNVLSMPEVAGGGACLVDPLDVASIRRGILRVMTDEEFQKTIVERGFENVKRFAPDRIASLYLNLYRLVAAEAEGREAS
jgi:glycosyltransferase involved in cell wall biosynthesis